MIKRIRNRFKNEKGQGMVEYGLILALVSIIAIGSLGILGGKVNGAFEKVNGVLGAEVVEDDDLVIPPALPEEEEEELYLATDADFEWAHAADGYSVPNRETVGYYYYSGDEERIKIPETIEGNTLTRYDHMFDSAGTFDGVYPTVTKVSSDSTHVTSMRGMFSNVDLPSLDLSGLNTSSVTSMEMMFYGAGIPTLDVSDFNTSNLQNTKMMFDGLTATTLNVSGWNTTSLDNAQQMFGKMLNITTLDLSSFDMSAVTNTEHMFIQSKATIGYAKTQGDADILNGTLNKPSGLTFTVR